MMCTTPEQKRTVAVTPEAALFSMEERMILSINLREG